MTISSHPDISTLMTCSAGSQPEALCAVVTSHLAMCSHCMNELKRMEMIGVSLFDSLDQQICIDRTQKLPPAPREQSKAKKIMASRTRDVPHPLVELIGGSLDAIKWQDLAPGVWGYQIPLTARAKGDLRLVKLAPDAQIQQVNHAGEQLILVLNGSYDTESITYQAGDFADIEDEHQHSITAGRHGCVLLIGNEEMPQIIGN
jgi:putative transcriptional regulator